MDEQLLFVTLVVIIGGSWFGRHSFLCLFTSRPAAQFVPDTKCTSDAKLYRNSFLPPIAQIMIIVKCEFPNPDSRPRKETLKSEIQCDSGARRNGFFGPQAPIYSEPLVEDRQGENCLGSIPASEQSSLCSFHQSISYGNVADGVHYKLSNVQLI